MKLPQRMFPVQPFDFIGRPREECCPHCGEHRMTDCIHNILTFVCGWSKVFAGDETPCQGNYFLPFYEEPDYYAHL